MGLPLGVELFCEGKQTKGGEHSKMDEAQEWRENDDEAWKGEWEEWDRSVG